ncbi:aminotransferase class I/II-fold pyridoxal phosphate-dependent enzyme [Streptococcus uberis]
MNQKDQTKAPIYQGLVDLRKKRIVPFDVPGHKRGRGNPELVELLGEKCVGIDVNSMKPLDNLGHPVSIIREAEELAADAFGAAHAFLMVGGTTSAVQAMILATVKAGDKIILPRNVHKSAINALVLCGAIPIYIELSVNHKIGIALGLENDRFAQAIKEHPDAKAVLINNPTYYGICSDLKGLTDLAHAAGMKVLVDGVSVYDFDVTKLSIYTQGIGLTGIEVYDLLRDEYDIQIEFGDIGNILAYISIGDRLQDIERLVGALADIKRLHARDGKDLMSGEYIQPELVLTPQEAFYAERDSVPLKEAIGHVCGELVMAYPPGIPILAPGERITEELIDYIIFSKERGCSIQGTEDPDVKYINIIKEA